MYSVSEKYSDICKIEVILSNFSLHKYIYNFNELKIRL